MQRNTAGERKLNNCRNCKVVTYDAKCINTSTTKKKPMTVLILKDKPGQK